MKPRILIVLSVLLLFSLLTGCNTADTPVSGDILYTNSELGFSLTFPEHWQDHYRIVPTEGGIAVNFYGESLAGQGAPKPAPSGLLMFYIIDRTVAEHGFLDSRQSVGTVKGIDYCYATGTDVTLSPIILSNESTVQAYARLFGDEIYGEPQLPLIHQDWEKAQQMLKDIPEILTSFTVL